MSASGQNIPCCPKFPWRDIDAILVLLAHFAALAWAGHVIPAMGVHSMAALACTVAALATLMDSNAAMAESDPFVVAMTGSFLSFVDLSIDL